MASNLSPLFQVEIATALVSAVDSWSAMRASLASVAQAAGRKQIASGWSLDRPGSAIWAELLPKAASSEVAVVHPEILSTQADPHEIKDVRRQAFHVLRFIPAPHCDYFLEFTMKVNNFDSWLAAFDSDGSAERAKDGLIDEVVARGVQDPNLVHLVFLVPDLNAARRGVLSQDRVCFSPDASVAGQPPFEFFRWTGAGTAG